MNAAKRLRWAHRVWAIKGETRLKPREERAAMRKQKGQEGLIEVVATPTEFESVASSLESDAEVPTIGEKRKRKGVPREIKERHSRIRD